MLRACVLEFKGSWEDKLVLIEYSYNNSHQSSIGMASYEALYRRIYRTLICWDDVSPSISVGPYLIKDKMNKVRVIREKMRIAQDR